MNKIGRFLRTIILGVNFIFMFLLLLTAYSPYINPATYQVLSCIGLAFPVFAIINICFLVFWIIVYRKYALLQLVILLVCVAQIRTYLPINLPGRDIPTNAIKLLSYNVMAFDAHKKHTKESPNPILQYILDSQSDIICLQEFITGNDKHHLRKEDVDKAMSDYPYRISHVIGEGENRLACYSKFPIISSRKLGFESMYNGSAIYEIAVNNDTLVVINNHLESNKLTYEDKATYVNMIKSPEKEKVSNGLRILIKKLAEASEIRGSQADFIAKQIDSIPNKKIIVCGDFNDSPISYTHRTISKNLKDAFVQSGQGLGISYNQNGFYFRIDNILLGDKLKPYNCTVDRSIKDSDHYPIWCYIAKE